MFWPEDEPEVAQRKLHIAISALPRSLNDSSPNEPSCSYIVYEHGVYSLNPGIVMQTNVDEFLHCYRVGQQAGEETDFI